jgi:protein-L-isoaspartate(D-aspartate) O-methyltransferase
MEIFCEVGLLTPMNDFEALAAQIAFERFAREQPAVSATTRQVGDPLGTDLLGMHAAGGHLAALSGAECLWVIVARDSDFASQHGRRSRGSGWPLSCSAEGWRRRDGSRRAAGPPRIRVDPYDNLPSARPSIRDRTGQDGWGVESAATARTGAARLSYVEELRFTANVRSAAVRAALAAVPRECFVGAGPWRVRSPMDLAEYWTTADADPRAVYHDVLIALDESRQINNGQPSLWAFLLDQLDVAAGEQVLHLGCGTAYYTAVMAELVGPKGKVTAIEIDASLAEKARVALERWSQITVSNADGASLSFEPADLMVASAGATHPLMSWLDALKPGGRLLFPMTASRRGRMLLVTREVEEIFAARFLCEVGFIDFRGARDPGTSRQLGAALARDWGQAVQSLRRDNHAKGRTCWLHGEGWCLSRRRPIATRSAAP